MRLYIVSFDEVPFCSFCDAYHDMSPQSERLWVGLRGSFRSCCCSKAMLPLRHRMSKMCCLGIKQCTCVPAEVCSLDLSFATDKSHAFARACSAFIPPCLPKPPRELKERERSAYERQQTKMSSLESISNMRAKNNLLNHITISCPF